MNYVTPHMQETPKSKEFAPIPPYEVVLKIAFYHPVRNIKMQEFAVLGSQKLTELKDVLYCLSDHIGDGRQTRSGYFFIENTFYNDMRHKNNVDYSR